MAETIEQESPECCDSCHFDGPVELYAQDHGGTGIVRRLWLCKLCASSLAGNVARYLTVYDGDVRILAGLIMNAANQILAELRKGDDSRS